MTRHAGHLKAGLRGLAPPLLLQAYRRLRYPIVASDQVHEAENFRAHELLNRESGPNEIVLREGIKLTVGPESRRTFEYFCFRSDEMVEEMNSFLRLAANKRKFLDVGALHGVFSLTFTYRRPEAEAVAVEPFPTAVAHLLYGLHKNPSCRVRVREVALSDKKGFIRMSLGSIHYIPSVGPLAPGRRTIEMESVTGDELCAEERFSPDLIKIDIEGHECECLLGLSDVLARCRSVVLIEIHPAMLTAAGRTTADVVALARNSHYLFYDLHGRKVTDKRVCECEIVRRFVMQPEEAA